MAVKVGEFMTARDCAMGAVANAIDNKLRTRFAPTRLSIEDESSQHRGHSGHREGGESHFRVEIVSAAFAPPVTFFT